VVPRSAIGPGVDDSELVIPGGYASRAAAQRSIAYSQSPAGKDWVTNGGNLTESALFDA